jgi:hypothetical protein
MVTGTRVSGADCGPAPDTFLHRNRLGGRTISARLKECRWRVSTKGGNQVAAAGWSHARTGWHPPLEDRAQCGLAPPRAVGLAGRSRGASPRRLPGPNRGPSLRGKCSSGQLRRRTGAGWRTHWRTGTKIPANQLFPGGLENRPTTFSPERVDPHAKACQHTSPLTANRLSELVPVLAPLHVDRFGDLPEHDPNNGHRLAGDEVILAEWHARRATRRRARTRSTWPAATRPRSSLTLPIALLEPLEHGPKVRIQLATGSDPTPATGVWLASGVRR